MSRPDEFTAPRYPRDSRICHYGPDAAVAYLTGLLGERHTEYQLYAAAEFLYFKLRTYNPQDADALVINEALRRTRIRK